MSARRPISKEGFDKLVTDVTDQLNDIELEHAIERVGLPPGPLEAFARRMASSMVADGHGEERHVWEAMVIGLLLGAKTEEWKNHARA